VTTNAEQERREAAVFTLWQDLEPLVGPLAHDLAHSDALARSGGQPQVSNVHREMLRTIPPRDLALATIRGVLISLRQPAWKSLKSGQRVQEVGYTVGFYALLAYLRAGHAHLSRRQADRYIAALAEQGTLTVAHMTGIGFHLIYALQRTSPELLQFHPPPTARGQSMKYGKHFRHPDASPRLSLAPAALAQYGAKWRNLDVHRPMLIPPRPWSAAQRGGYGYALAESVPLIRNVSALDADPTCPPVVYAALNALQETAWRINTAVLPVARQLQAMLTKEERWIVDEATNEADSAALYFVHSLDFCGRIYPTGHYLTPQGPDLARALLTFANGCTITPTPEGDPAIAALEQYGRQCLDTVLDREQVQAIGHDPLGTQQLWAAAKKPWQYLAFCIERAALADAHDAGTPYVSTLPVWQDALANGFQHMALLLGDERLAARVGLLPSNKPGDVYDDVAELMTARLWDFARSESYPEHHSVPKDLMMFLPEPATDLLQHFGGKITRDVAKGPTMRFGYGEDEGLEDSFAEEHGLDDDLNACFARALHETLQNPAGVTAKAVELREWFQAVGQAIAQTEKPAKWCVPGTRFPAGQQTFKVKPVRMLFMWKGVKYPRVRVNVPVAKLSKQDHARSLAPNVIHSLDAAHLMLTVTQLPAGTSIGTVHDGFATCATMAPKLEQSLKEAFVGLYEAGQHPLDDLVEQFGHQSVEMPTPPERGALRLSASEDWCRAKPIR
jgi:DNA-directed RNA polymerase